jgi:hypothetical protein
LTPRPPRNKAARKSKALPSPPRLTAVQKGKGRVRRSPSPPHPISAVSTPLAQASSELPETEPLKPGIGGIRFSRGGEFL